MSDFPTIQVGLLALRKTSDGWEYLSEGLQGEPDRWCDASSMLGPFSGSGVSTLLDELLAARQETEVKARNVCRNCRWWDSSGNCDFIDTIQGERIADSTGCQIVVHVHDDSGLYTELKTGPNFTCPSFTSLPASSAPAVDHA